MDLRKQIAEGRKKRNKDNGNINIGYKTSSAMEKQQPAQFSMALTDKTSRKIFAVLLFSAVIEVAFFAHLQSQPCLPETRSGHWPPDGSLLRLCKPLPTSYHCDSTLLPNAFMCILDYFKYVRFESSHISPRGDPNPQVEGTIS